MVGLTPNDEGAQGLKSGPLVNEQSTEVALYRCTHSAAFISNPSSILSEGMIG